MPLPLLFIGVAAATGSFGVGSTIKAGIDANKAKRVKLNSFMLASYSCFLKAIAMALRRISCNFVTVWFVSITCPSCSTLRRG